MNNETETYKKVLCDIARILDNIEYECSSSIYTLDDDDMGLVFDCRDLIQKTLNAMSNR